jgi:hypothetical protein
MFRVSIRPSLSPEYRSESMVRATHSQGVHGRSRSVFELNWLFFLDLGMVDRRLHDDLREICEHLKAPRFDLHRRPWSGPAVCSESIIRVYAPSKHGPSVWSE